MEAGNQILPVDIIEKSLFFSGLPPLTTAKLASVAEVKKTRKGGLLFNRGDKALGFYLLASGEVRLFFEDQNGRERVIKIIQPGEVFGEAAIFQKDGFPCSALAQESLTALFFPKREILELLGSDREMALAFFGVLAQKLAHFISLTRLALKDVLPRVAEYLLTLPLEGDQLSLPPKKTVMAKILGVTAESLSRALSKLKKDRLIAERPRLTILNREALRLVAAGIIPENPISPPGAKPSNQKAKN
ncbi:MAG: Crp/Fnr family transcriptional regulator [Deltaproteobacteria bacterium]|jgi:CRP/FNR family transcriptional regulator|nr:Crp/Fnr family transcriptional regulator [Deltaproteobacteria bacterium]